MTKPERIKELIKEMKESLEIEAKYYNVRKKMVKICKTLNPQDIDQIWDDGLFEVTAAWEQKKDDAYEMSNDGTRKMWQKRTYAQKYWLRSNTKGYVCRGGAKNSSGHNGHKKLDTGAEHEAFSRNSISVEKPLSYDGLVNWHRAVIAEIKLKGDVTVGELEKAGAEAMRDMGVK